MSLEFVTTYGDFRMPVTPDNKTIGVEARRFAWAREAAARLVAERLSPDDDVVLLGSIASDKYVEPLLGVFGDRLLFPVDFVGRGDMSRGGLLLRARRAGVEPAYGKVLGAVRHGPKPPRLPPLPRRSS